MDPFDSERIVDFTEKKLFRMSRSLPTRTERDACATLLGLYLSGSVAVKWHRGSPRYIKIPGG